MLSLELVSENEGENACRLGNHVYASGLLRREDGLMTLGKLKPKHRINKVSSQVEATWKYSLPMNVDKTRVKELWRTQLQHFATLLTAIESHPGFERDWQPQTVIPVRKDITYVSAPEVRSKKA